MFIGRQIGLFELLIITILCVFLLFPFWLTVLIRLIRMVEPQEDEATKKRE